MNLRWLADGYLWELDQRTDAAGRTLPRLPALMLDETTPNHARSVLAHERDAAPGLAEQRRGLVKRWRWAGGDADWDEPGPIKLRVHSERSAHKRPGNYMRYGLDEDDQIVISEEVYVHDHGGESIYRASLWTLKEGRPTWLSLSLSDPFEPSGVLDLAKVVVCGEGGRTAALHSASDGTEWIEIYTYERGVLPSSSWRFRQRSYDDPDWWTQRIRYDDAGVLLIEGATTDPEGRPVEDFCVQYRRPSSMLVKAARRRVREELPPLIHRWTKRNCDGPSYCLVLAYSEESPLPPSLALGSSVDLRRQLSRKSPDAQPHLWNPADLSCFDPLPDEFEQDKELFQAFELLNQEWSDLRDTEDAHRLLSEIAKTLRTYDWSGVADEPGFAVLAVDLELSDLEAALRAASAAEIVRRFATEG